MCVNYITALSGWRIAIYCVFDGHEGGLSSKWCGIHVPHLVAGHLALIHGRGEASEEDETLPTFVRKMPAALDRAFREADQELTVDNVGTSGTTATVAILAEMDDGRRWLVVANVGDSAALLAASKNDCAKVLHHLDFEPFFDYEGKHEIRKPPYDKPNDPYSHLPIESAKIHLSQYKRTKNCCFYFKANHKGDVNSEERRVKMAGGKISYNRVNGALAMTRALGDHHHGPCVSARPTVFVCAIPNKPKDAGTNYAWLMLASDGYFDFVIFLNAAEKMLKLDSSSILNQTVREMVQNAYDAGSKDDISVMLVRLDYD